MLSSHWTKHLQVLAQNPHIIVIAISNGELNDVTDELVSTVHH